MLDPSHPIQANPRKNPVVAVGEKYYLRLMIMLICRWMCPESLHVYRRMGTREHERLINQASTVNVDAIQSANVV